MVGGLALIAAGVGVGWFGAAIPNRQVFYERGSGRISVVAGRKLGANAKPRVVSRRRLDEFAHVRFLRRQYAASLGDDGTPAPRWFVFLEGAIPFADEEGVVHTRDDALELVDTVTEHHARRVAFETAHHTGLPIFEARDTFGG